MTDMDIQNINYYTNFGIKIVSFQRSTFGRHFWSGSREWVVQTTHAPGNSHACGVQSSALNFSFHLAAEMYLFRWAFEGQQL